jgi:hypothetical protein
MFWIAIFTAFLVNAALFKAVVHDTTVKIAFNADMTAPCDWCFGQICCSDVCAIEDPDHPFAHCTDDEVCYIEGSYLHCWCSDESCTSAIV